MALIKKSTAAERIGRSVSSLERLYKTDNSFPRAIKMGTNRQSAVFFDQAEVDVWIERQKMERNLKAAEVQA